MKVTSTRRHGRWFVSLFVLFLLLVPVRELLRKRREPDATRLLPELPLPGAADGRFSFKLRLWGSSLLIFFVPNMLRQMSRHSAGDRRAATRAIEDPAGYHQSVRYSLPFAGEWYIVNGGTDKANAHSWNVANQRYAYDFVISDYSLRRWPREKRGARLEDYFCYGRFVLAPASGVVIEVRNDILDAPSPGTGWVEPFTQDFRGNFVTIQHADSEYSFLAHMIPGSVRVKKGDRVERGQEVGLCGNSGHSTEPHLHFHIQDRADFFEAAGLPVVFDGVSTNGGEPTPGSYLQRGTHVRSANR